ncbi:MAG TPA: type II toxin-antitoxin system prevent-host-death family antitoxin [Terriglobales bacterium]|nr:type II toxin-antitoxin system prevent-host-death family antitoxin [Terriglobales bacterium]
MTAVGIRELKAGLSGYLRRVRRGERVQITDRGTVVAEIVPAGWGADRDVPPGLAALAREGRAHLATQPRRRSYPPFRVRVPAGTVQRLLDEGRGER